MQTLDAKKTAGLRLLRFGFFLYFGNLSFVFFGIPILGWRQSALPQVRVAEVILCPVFGVVFAVAAWLALRAWRSQIVRGHGWLIGASLLNLLNFVAVPLIYGYRGGVDDFWAFERFFWIPQGIGALGLIVFSRSPAALKTGKGLMEGA